MIAVTGATITYRDVSHFQGAYVPTGPTCAKATEGTTFIDSQYAGIRKRTLAGGWPFLAYHFLHHGSIDAQVDHVFSVVGRQPLMLDVESETGRTDPTLADVLAFADRWHTVTGQRVTLAYIPRWFWSGHWGSPSLTGLMSRRIGLVSSLYDHGHADDGPGWDPYGGVTPVIWQYTSTPYDTNAFKGTVAQLADLWANGTPTPTPPEEDMPLTPDDAKLVVNTLKADPSYVDLTWRVQAIANALDSYAAGSMKGDPVELTRMLKALSTTALPAASLSDADKADIAKRVADLIAARLAS